MTEQLKKSNQTNAEEVSLTAEQAMNDVLEAEHNAREAVARCKSEAEALLQQARQKSQRIGKQTNDRITRIHQRVSRVMTDQVKKLEEEQRVLAQQEHLYRIESDVIEIVVNQIAEMLTTQATLTTELNTKEEDG